MLKQLNLQPKENRFLKVNRLLTKNDYQDVFKKGKRIYSHTFCLFYRTNTESTNRLGVVVGKKKIAKAVNRNVVKRQVREFFRLRKSDMDGVDVVVLVNRKPPATQTTYQLRQELKALWLKLPHGLKKF